MGQVSKGYRLMHLSTEAENLNRDPVEICEELSALKASRLYFHLRFDATPRLLMVLLSTLKGVTAACHSHPPILAWYIILLPG